MCVFRLPSQTVSGLLGSWRVQEASLLANSFSVLRVSALLVLLYHGSLEALYYWETLEVNSNLKIQNEWR